jgi:hypothetical protein
MLRQPREMGRTARGEPAQGSPRRRQGAGGSWRRQVEARASQRESARGRTQEAPTVRRAGSVVVGSRAPEGAAACARIASMGVAAACGRRASQAEAAVYGRHAGAARPPHLRVARRRRLRPRRSARWSSFGHCVTVLRRRYHGPETRRTIGNAGMDAGTRTAYK